MSVGIFRQSMSIFVLCLSMPVLMSVYVCIFAPCCVYPSAFAYLCLCFCLIHLLQFRSSVCLSMFVYNFARQWGHMRDRGREREGKCDWGYFALSLPLCVCFGLIDGNNFSVCSSRSKKTKKGEWRLDEKLLRLSSSI